LESLKTNNFRVLECDFNITHAQVAANINLIYIKEIYLLSMVGIIEFYRRTIFTKKTFTSNFVIKKLPRVIFTMSEIMNE